MQEESASSAIIRFGTFELDVRAGELRKRGAKIRLQEQPLRILEMLLARPGQLVTREELRSWLWPSDTFVDSDHGLNKAINKLRQALGDSPESPRFVETIPRRGYRVNLPLAKASARAKSVAVLPLEDLSQDPAQEYFADGLTEALITSLAHISALRVTSRTTAMTYKGARKSIPDIARELGVHAVVEGTVLCSGKCARISAQLISTRGDTLLWAESYDRDLGDVMALQSEVAQTIARQVEAKLTPREQAQLGSTRQLDPRVLEGYLKCRYFRNKRAPESMIELAKCFQRAIDKDSDYPSTTVVIAMLLVALELLNID